jgi:hypothetical protein
MTIKDALKHMLGAFGATGVSTDDASKSMARFSEIMNQPLIGNGDSFTVTSSTSTTDGNSTSDWPSSAVWITDQTWVERRYVDGTADRVTLTDPESIFDWTSNTVDLSHPSVVESEVRREIMDSGGTDAEIDMMCDLAQIISISLREVLTVFTEIGEKYKVRREIAVSQCLAHVTCYLENGLFDITSRQYIVLLAKDRYLCGWLLDEESEDDTVSIEVKSKSNTVPLVRAIRIPGMKPKKRSSKFVKRDTIGAHLSLSIPVYATDDPVQLSKDGHIYIED